MTRGRWESLSINSDYFLPHNLRRRKKLVLLWRFPFLVTVPWVTPRIWYPTRARMPLHPVKGRTFQFFSSFTGNRLKWAGPCWKLTLVDQASHREAGNRERPLLLQGMCFRLEALCLVHAHNVAGHWLRLQTLAASEQQKKDMGRTILILSLNRLYITYLRGLKIMWKEV